MTKKEKALVEKEQAGLPISAEELEAMSGQGFEDTDKDAFAIPFLRILQSNSPQVNEDEASYIQGAKAGIFFNTITRKLYNKEMTIIPVHYNRDFVEWLPERKGFVQSHGNDPAILERVVEIDDKNNSILDNGNIIQDVRNHFVLLADEIEAGPIIFSLAKSGIKHSKKWMTLMNNLLIPGKKKAAPMFSGIWRAWTLLNKNDDGSWYQVGDDSVTAIEFDGWVNKEQLDAATAARKLLMSGKAQADYESTVDAGREPGEEEEGEKGSSKGSKKDDTPF